MALSPQEKITIETYDRTARARRQTVNSTQFNSDFWLAEALKLKELARWGCVLDIGCGDARHAWPFRRDDLFDYFGTDLSEGMLAEAKFHSPDANFSRMNFNNLGFRDKTFDCFWAAASLFHCPKNKVSVLIKEIWRVTKTNGFGLITLKEGEGEKLIGALEKGDQRFFAYYNLEEFHEILLANGFQAIQCWRDLREYNPPVCSNVWLLYFVKKI